MRLLYILEQLLFLFLRYTYVIIFIVSYFGLHTFLPVVLPLLEVSQKLLFGDTLYGFRHGSLDIFGSLNMTLFDHRFGVLKI